MGQTWIYRSLPLAVLLVGLLAVLTGATMVGAALGRDSSSSEPVAASALAPVFTPEVQHWAGAIAHWAASHALDPNLVATVMQIESCGHPQAVSGSGAQGLFQVMPFHFAPGEPMQDPDVNAARGLGYLALGLERGGGQVHLALAGYNGGHSVIGWDASLWPAETQRYVYWGAGIYNDALSGGSDSPRLQEWLAAGGASLCAQAAQALGLSA